MSAWQKVKHPSIYEINTRPFLREIADGDSRPQLKDIPDVYWREVASRGIDLVWLMGIWSLAEKQYTDPLIPSGMMAEFEELIPGLSDDDIDGSPYAIDAYEVDPVLGDEDQLAGLRKKLNNLGMGLMLDFIPNHFGANSRWIDHNPEYFIAVDTPPADNGNHKTFYTPARVGEGYYAHGKDPYFNAWQDTAQVNYANPATRAWMADRLRSLAKKCDGVRCDMAMLSVRRIFNKTWQGYTDWRDEQEFWPRAIRKAKEKYPRFTLLAECYWDMEGELLEMGFDYCYDKSFLDNVRDRSKLRKHFQSSPAFLNNTARFLENHDEQRVSSQLDLQQHAAAAALVAFGPGMRFWHDGQWEGRRKRTPVQLNRFAPEVPCCCLIQPPDREEMCGCIQTLYDNLLPIAKKKIFKRGKWHNLSLPEDVQNVFLWHWQWKSKDLLVAINYGPEEHKLDLGILHKLGFKLKKHLYRSQTYKGDQRLVLPGWCVNIWKVKVVK